MKEFKTINQNKADIEIGYKEQKQHLIDIMKSDEKLGLYEEPKQEETLEEFAEIFVNNRFTKQICGDESYPDILASKSSVVESHILFAKWQQSQYTIEEQHIERSIGELEKEYIKGFNEGSAYQQERSYSEEEVLDILKELEIECVINPRRTEIREWFEQFKKK